MDLQLRDQVAVITGGAAGIGLATAELFYREGAKVAIWDRAANTPEIAMNLDSNRSGRVCGSVLDIGSEEQVQSAVKATLQSFGRVDHVVHCAAIGSSKFGFPFTNVPTADWRRTIEVNIMGMVHVAHAFEGLMRKAGSGTFVFLGSIAGQIGSQTDPPYSASKAATINFAQCMAKDLAPHGIRVNTVCPGMVRTGLNESVWKAWWDQTPLEERVSYEIWASRKIEQVIPLKTWQTAQDVANMIVFLSSKCASQVTGQTINVDGGCVMHW
jgi:NAD(P)-dependent dehydrogenase (short-subunit alcohol dehydrogenase family)